MVCPDGWTQLGDAFPDRQNCSSYYNCTASGPVHNQCPEGQLFNAQLSHLECEHEGSDFCGGRS